MAKLDNNVSWPLQTDRYSLLPFVTLSEDTLPISKYSIAPVSDPFVTSRERLANILWAITINEGWSFRLHNASKERKRKRRSRIT
jgi:hypothetical protein